MNILLVRHGETAWNREGRYQGRTDIPLSPDGERQVRALGERLSATPIAVAIASPLSRARTTAEAILASRSEPVLELDAGLLEISHGAWEGMLASDVELSHAELFGVWRTAPGRSSPAGPGAETLGDVEARAWAVLENACARLGANDTLLITAHDAVNRVILCRVLGLPLERVWRFRQAPAALNILSGPSLDDLQIVRLNDSEHSQPMLSTSQHRAL
ncbi:MAG: histidine phosphatase family protein [Deltaproteobacteria bacterium]|nr:histidine phosphatase family protein [Deltaproteobacteria bacterium]